MLQSEIFNTGRKLTYSMGFCSGFDMIYLHSCNEHIFVITVAPSHGRMQSHVIHECPDNSLAASCFGNKHQTTVLAFSSLTLNGVDLQSRSGVGKRGTEFTGQNKLGNFSL